ncbi:MAG: signal transduction histidine kinase [Herminiimonas sp.]|nr:signal transduction histidine kinase [Herminiimonas sp.]
MPRSLRSVLPEPQDFRSTDFFVAATRLLSLVVMLGGSTVILAWYWQTHFALTPFSGSMPAVLLSVPANTAGLLCCAGFALLLRADAPEPVARGMHPRVVFSTVLSMGVLLVGLLALLEAAIGSDLGLSGWSSAIGLGGVMAAAGHTPVTVTAGLVLAGLALLLLDARIKKDRAPAEYIAIVLAALMAIPLIGYLYSVTAMVKVASGGSVAPMTACLFIVLAAGILMARPEHPVMRVWNSNAPGGHLLRRLLPKSLLLLVVLDLLVEAGARRNLYSPDSISALVILLVCCWLSVLFWRAAAMLNREYDERRQGAAALSETHALLRAVSDNTPDAIYVKDVDGRFVFANPATLRLLDMPAENVIGKTGAEIYADANDAQRAAVSDHEVMSSRQAQMIEETMALAQGVRTFYSTKAPWQDSNGKLCGLVGISTDISDRKRVEDALREHETQLEALVAARTAEVSELMGHLEATREEEKRAIARELHDDLGSALTALNMHLAILFQQMPQDPKLTERFAHVKGLLSSVGQTTRRIQVGLRPDKLDIFGIKTAIADLADEFQNYTGVTCRASLPDEDLSYAPQIDIALFRMVQESLNNIAKHAHATEVDVVLDDVDDHVNLSIRDNGVGIVPVRTASSTTHGLRGMRERAGYLGGEVQIISSPGKGTHVMVRLPKTPRVSSTAELLEERRANGEVG